MAIEHKDIQDPNIHEPKGISTASVGEVYVGDGVSAGNWKKLLPSESIDSETAGHGQIIVAKGDGTVDFEVPVWKDLIGDITPKTSGPGAPTLTAFRGGNVRGFAYSAGDDGDCVFHIPHDYKPGSDLFVHLHWAHNGTAISGNLVVGLSVTYAKGHAQAIYAAEINPNITVATPNIATVPQYSHRIDEIQLSAAAPTASQLDSALIEPDGIILLHFDVTTIPTITGGTPNEPFILTLDLHYQSTYVGTKNKVPNFYS